MKQIETIQFVDLDSGNDALIIVRASTNQIALCISKKEDGDIEVLFRAEECKQLLEALQQAVVVAEKVYSE